MLFKELAITFPWYEKKEQQNRYNENAEPYCDYKLISPKNALLPFQFWKEQTTVPPVAWEIYEINSENLITTISGNIGVLRIIQVDGKDYYTYDGSALTLNLAPGFYYSRMVWSDLTIFYSEMFFVPEKNAFNIADDDDIEFLKLVWYNDSDLKPIFYNDKQLDTTPYFKNVVYLDSFITASEPEIQEDGERDGNDELIPTFQKAIIAYTITDLVPDFLKKAMVLIQIHDHVFITTKRAVRSGEINRMAVNTNLEANGALSTVNLVFQEEIILKQGCGENMILG